MENPFVDYTEDKLKKMATRQLLNIKNSIYRKGISYWRYPDEEKYFEFREQALAKIKAELSTRAHIMNMQESKADRIARKNSGDSRKRKV